MILIGQYDSPFVRRVAIALRLYGLPFEHRPWSTFGDADKIAPYNPLRRVPTLVLDSGEALIESAMMLDYLDELRRAGQGDDAPPHGEARRRQLRICALATGLADKGGQPALRARAAQGAAHALGRALRGADRRACSRCWKRSARRSTTPYWFGERIGHADIAVACALRFVGEAHPALFDARYPALQAHAARCEALPEFRRSCSRWRRRRGEAFLPSPLVGEGGAKRRMRGLSMR